MNVQDRIIVALDVSSVREAHEIVSEVEPYVGGFKIGMQFIYSLVAKVMNGDKDGRVPEELNEVPSLIKSMKGKLFLDVKIDDIPNTLAGTAKEIASIHPLALNVMASAGIDGMLAVSKVKGDAKLWIVTVLTSKEENDAHLTFGAPSKAKALQYSREAKLSMADGIICSPQELALLKPRPELQGLEFANPGIRPAWSVVGDQKRIMAPADALKAGADRLIIGRPITNHPNCASRAEACERILEEIMAVNP